jgi:type III pantothenate kinase
MIASAVAAYESYGGPSIVLDFGTATTIAALTQDGRFIGASIAPGLETSCDAIYRRAPHLTRIKLLPPPSVIGRNTVHSMQSGILLGHACLVDGMVERFREAMGGSARVIATGGLAEAVKEQSMCIEVVRPDLILEGIRIIHLRNRR